MPVQVECNLFSDCSFWVVFNSDFFRIVWFFWINLHMNAYGTSEGCILTVMVFLFLFLTFQECNVIFIFRYHRKNIFLDFQVLFIFISKRKHSEFRIWQVIVANASKYCLSRWRIASEKWNNKSLASIDELQKWL